MEKKGTISLRTVARRKVCSDEEKRESRGWQQLSERYYGRNGDHTENSRNQRTQFDAKGGQPRGKKGDEEAWWTKISLHTDRLKEVVQWETVQDELTGSKRFRRGKEQGDIVGANRKERRFRETSRPKASVNGG